MSKFNLKLTAVGDWRHRKTNYGHESSHPGWTEVEGAGSFVGSSRGAASDGRKGCARFGVGGRGKVVYGLFTHVKLAPSHLLRAAGARSTPQLPAGSFLGEMLPRHDQVAIVWDIPGFDARKATDLPRYLFA
jgi:hypothetical protein